MYAALYRTLEGRLELLEAPRAVAPATLAEELRAPGGAARLPGRRGRALRRRARRDPRDAGPPGAGRPPPPVGGHGGRAGGSGARPRGGVGPGRACCRSICAPRKRSSRVSDGSVPDIRIEPMRAADLEAVLQIERASFRTPVVAPGLPARARAESRRRALGGARRAAPASPDAAAVVGYLCLWAVADEVHVTNLAVHPAWRGEGIGRLLLGTLLAYHRGQGARRGLPRGAARRTRRRAGSTRASASRRWAAAGATTSTRARTPSSWRRASTREIFSPGSATRAAGPEIDRSAERNPSAG